LKVLETLTGICALIIFASCSEPHGWTLWIHEYTVAGDALHPSSDDWRSLDTYLTSAECKKQENIHLALIEKSIREEERKGSFGSYDGYKLTVEKVTQGIAVATVSAKTPTDAKPMSFTTRTFCLPLGMDPRPKDPVTWSLWRHQTTWNKNGFAYESWQPEESFLVEWKCARAKASNQKIYNSYNEKSEKEAKGQRYTKTYFRCAPSTVNPWGE
jgi:hypothetical protein